METMESILARWDSDEGKPYKGELIDIDAFKDGGGIGCMCAQGQVLHLLGGWGADDLDGLQQGLADAEAAKLLNISRAHAVLLRNINDGEEGAPSIVLRNPGALLGDQWSKLLDFWWAFDQFDADQWGKVAAAGAAAGAAAWVAAWVAAKAAAWDAAWDAARVATRDAAGAAAWDAAWDAAGDAARVAARVVAGAAARVATGAAARDAAGAATGEIQGFEVLTQRGRDVFFLPIFGWASPDEIPARPAGYGLGVVPQ